MRSTGKTAGNPIVACLLLIPEEPWREVVPALGRGPVHPFIPTQHRTIRMRRNTHRWESHSPAKSFTGITSFPASVDGRKAGKDTPSWNEACGPPFPRN